MWAALRLFILALPGLAKLCENILNGIQEIVETEKENALTKKEILASQKAQLTKDSSDLEQIFRGT